MRPSFVVMSLCLSIIHQPLIVAGQAAAVFALIGWLAPSPCSPIFGGVNLPGESVGVIDGLKAYKD